MIRFYENKMILLAVLSVIFANLYCLDAQAKRLKNIALEASAILNQIDLIPFAPIRKKVKSKFIDVFDANGDKVIDQPDEKKALVAYFREFDRNRNGQLSRSEFSRAMKNLKNKTGKSSINHAEF